MRVHGLWGGRINPLYSLDTGCRMPENLARTKSESHMPISKQKHSQLKKVKGIPIQVGKDKTISLSPGTQSMLIRKVIQGFCEIFTPGGKLAYASDPVKECAYFDKA